MHDVTFEYIKDLNLNLKIFEIAKPLRFSLWLDKKGLDYI